MVRKAAGVIISISWQILICVLVIILLYHAGTKGYAFGKEIFSPSAMAYGSGTDVILIVEKEASDKDIAELLEKKGLISDWKVFYVQMKLYNSDIQSGTYTLNTAMTSEEILNLMEAGQAESAEESS